MLRSAPLHQAAGLGQVEIVRMLVFEAGADKNIRDSRGWSALQWACSYGALHYNM